MTPTTMAVPSQSSSTAMTDPITRPTERSPVRATAMPSTTGGTHEITGRIAYAASPSTPVGPRGHEPAEPLPEQHDRERRRDDCEPGGRTREERGDDGCEQDHRRCAAHERHEVDLRLADARSRAVARARDVVHAEPVGRDRGGLDERHDLRGEQPRDHEPRPVPGEARPQHACGGAREAAAHQDHRGQQARRVLVEGQQRDGHVGGGRHVIRPQVLRRQAQPG